MPKEWSRLHRNQQNTEFKRQLCLSANTQFLVSVEAYCIEILKHMLNHWPLSEIWALINEQGISLWTQFLKIRSSHFWSLTCNSREKNSLLRIPELI